MKVNSSWHLARKGVFKTEQTHSQRIGNSSFSDTLNQQHDRATEEKLKRMLEHIHLQGERLAKSMTMRELVNYRLGVRQFLEETARRGISLRDTKGVDRRGRTRRYKMLEEIDKELLTMADDMLTTEAGRLELLKSIGEIKGLLMNFLF